MANSHEVFFLSECTIAKLDAIAGSTGASKEKNRDTEQYVFTTIQNCFVLIDINFSCIKRNTAIGAKQLTISERD